MVLTLTFCLLASSWRALRAASSSLNEAVAVFGLTLIQRPGGFTMLLVCPNVTLVHRNEIYLRLHLSAENTLALYASPASLPCDVFMLLRIHTAVADRRRGSPMPPDGNGRHGRSDEQPGFRGD